MSSPVARCVKYPVALALRLLYNTQIIIFTLFVCMYFCWVWEPVITGSETSVQSMR